jgi:exodeoxyribonuclease VII small subunit
MPEETPTPAQFEISLAELDKLVKELERGDLPLEKSIELFERGMKLSAECRKQLEAAETRVEVLMRRGGETVAVPFKPEKS